MTLGRDRCLLLYLLVSEGMPGREAHGAGETPSLDLAWRVARLPGQTHASTATRTRRPCPARGLNRVDTTVPTSTLTFHETRSETSAAFAAGSPATPRRGTGGTGTQRSPGPEERPEQRRSGHVPRPQPHGGPREGRPFPHGPNALQTRPAAPASCISLDSPAGHRGTRA